MDMPYLRPTTNYEKTSLYANSAEKGVVGVAIHPCYENYAYANLKAIDENRIEGHRDIQNMI